MRNANLSEHIGGSASVYMAAAMEFMLSELLVACVDECLEMKQKRITPRHIQLGIRQNGSLDYFLRNVIIPWAGVVPFIEPELIPLPSKKPKPKPLPTRRVSVDY